VQNIVDMRRLVVAAVLAAVAALDMRPAAAEASVAPAASVTPVASVTPAASVTPNASVTPAAPADVQLAMSVNPPFRWIDGSAISGSLYVGFNQHHAIRANVARYTPTNSSSILAGALVFDTSGNDVEREGRHLDIGAGYTYFTRKLWSGLMFEIGMFVRDTDTHTETTDGVDVTTVDVRSKTYAARGHVGWSFLFYDHFFVSVAVGVSRGHEVGKETTSSSGGMPETADVSRAVLSAESFVRLGGAFGL
jgi:hypothetical protein